MKIFLLLVATLSTAGLVAGTAVASELGVIQVGFHDEEGFFIDVPSAPDTYLVLMRGTAPQQANSLVAVVLPDSEDLMVRLGDAEVFSRSFYSVHRISTTDPVDSDGDGIDDLFELQHPFLLDAVNSADASEDADGDSKSNLAEYLAETDLADVRESTVSFTTSDNIGIQSTLRLPAARSGTKLPAVILIHQGFGSRTEWRPYDDAFSDAGYATLAYDIRGHGGSGGSFSNVDFDNPNTSPKDLQAAIAYLKARDDIDSTRIGIVGASVGGNLACVASQNRWVKTAVNLSGKTSAVRNLAAERNLDLVSMFQISSAGDQGGQRALWANELYGFTSEPRLVEVVPRSSAHGVAIFRSDPSLLDRIVDWLGETL